MKEPMPRETKTITIEPIVVPSIPLDELKDKTNNFSQDALIGEGSFGRVYYGLLNSGQASAIKKLDSSKQPDQEFLAQVCPMKIYCINMPHSTLSGTL